MKHRLAGVVAMLVLGAAIGPASAQASPCSDWPFTHPGKSKLHAATIPELGGATSYPADVLRPKKLSSKHTPGVVLLHGGGGSKCSLWWAARLLAGKGYETVVLTYPSGAGNGESESNAATAARSALAWMRTPANPYFSLLRVNDLALVGHSLGSSAAADVQSDPALTYLKTIVALDNLRAFAVNDAGGGTGCSPSPSVPVTPRVPALGLGSVTLCPTHPAIADKTTGYRLWRAAGVYAEEAVLANTTHGHYAGSGVQTVAHTRQLRHASYYMVAWLARWLHHDGSQGAELLSQTPFGIPVTDMLTKDTKTHNLTSSAFLPSKECPRLRHCP